MVTEQIVVAAFIFRHLLLHSIVMNKHLARGCVSLHFFFHGTLSNVEKVRMQIDFFTIAEETCAQKIAVAFAKMNKHTDFKQT